MFKLLVPMATFLMLAMPSVAQTYKDAVARLASVSADLTFPMEAAELSFLSRPQMAIYKPSGDGPEIVDWAKRLVTRGYIAFVVDPVTQRGPPVCVPTSPSNHYRGTKDAFQALAHLKRFPFVAQERVGLLGFSWGAMVSLLASSQTFAELFSPSQRFVAAVGFYPLCPWRSHLLTHFRSLEPDPSTAQLFVAARGREGMSEAMTMGVALHSRSRR